MKNKMEIKKKNTLSVNGFIISFHRHFFVHHLELKTTCQPPSSEQRQSAN